MSDASRDSDSASRPGTAGSVRATVSTLGVHPVKSLRARHPDRWAFDATGPFLDRRWMLVDENGRFLSLREEPRLARFRVDWDDAATLDGGDPPDRLRIVHDDGDLTVECRRETDHRTAVLWGSERVVIDEGDEAATWFGRRLDRAVRLVRHLPDRDPWRQADPPARRAAMGLSDGYPVLVVARATIEAAVGPDWSPDRFRANIVVDGVPAHAEDHWARLAVGGIELELVKPCVRCVATTVEPVDGVRTGTEPLSTLARTRTWRGGPVLGWNALVTRAGSVSLGDPVTVLAPRTDGRIEGLDEEARVAVSPRSSDPGP